MPVIVISIGEFGWMDADNQHWRIYNIEIKLTHHPPALPCLVLPQPLCMGHPTSQNSVLTYKGGLEPWMMSLHLRMCSTAGTLTGSTSLAHLLTCSSGCPQRCWPCCRSVGQTHQNHRSWFPLVSWPGCWMVWHHGGWSGASHAGMPGPLEPERQTGRCNLTWCSLLTNQWRIPWTTYRKRKALGSWNKKCRIQPYPHKQNVSK